MHLIIQHLEIKIYVV